VAITTVRSSLGDLLSKDAVKILTEDEVEKRTGHRDVNKKN
jgi:hypothetical protein